MKELRPRLVALAFAVAFSAPLCAVPQRGEPVTGFTALQGA